MHASDGDPKTSQTLWTSSFLIPLQSVTTVGSATTSIGSCRRIVMTRMSMILSLVAALSLGLTFGASPIFFQQFGDKSWESIFKQSTDSKYSGVLQAEIPEGLEEPALKVTTLITQRQCPKE